MRTIFCILLLLPVAAITAQSNNNFIPGEKLEYQIYFGPLNAGMATSFLRHDTMRGKEVYYSEFLGTSTGLADRIYRIRDLYGGYFDPETLLPLQSIRDIREGNYRKFESVDYFHDSLKVYSSLSGEHEIPANIRDMVSLLFYVRQLDFDTMQYDDLIDIDTWFDDEIFPFDIRYRGRETIRTRSGTYNCIKLVPFVEPGRIFRKEDDMTLWFSDDANCVPIRIKFDLIVGSVKCDLIKFEGLKY